MSQLGSQALTGSATITGTVDTNLKQVGGVATSLGAKVMASSIPVVIASDQSGVPVTGTFWQATQPVSGTVTANQGGTWTVQPGNTANTTAWKVDGSAVTQPVSGTVTANAGTNLNTSALALESGGNLATVAGAIIAQSTALGTIKELMVAGSVTTAAPTYTTGNINPLSLTTSGALRVDIGATSANTTAVKVDGSAVTQPVSATSLPLPTGASTAAKQPALGTAGTASADVITVQGIASMTKLLVTPDSVALPANQSVNVAQINGVTPLMGNGVTGTGSPRVTIASDNTAFAVNATLSAETTKVIGTVNQGTSPWVANVSQLGGTNTVTAGVNGTLAVGGNVATNVAIGTNPVNLGAQGVSSENTAITATRMVQLVADLVGKLIVMPYANKENFLNGTTAAITGTAATQIIAAQGVGVKIYCTSLIVTNSHATVGTLVTIQDNSATPVVLYEGYAASAGGGFVCTFPVPIVTTANQALMAINGTTGANVYVAAAGYKGT